MPYLDVPGASIYHESVGTGPMLLCISGADGSCEIWRDMADCLKEHFTVVMWDRRGFSRSFLNGAQDYERRIETDADDAATLIRHFSPSEPATVIGNSSGAIVALKLLQRTPDLIRTLMAYEPPEAKLVQDSAELWTAHQETYATYRRSGVLPALQKFAGITKADQANLQSSIDSRTNQYINSNIQYWFEREFLVYPFTEFDVDQELRPFREKLVLVNGELTSKEPYQYRANVALGEKLGLQVEHFPGEHVGHATHASDFAKKLVEALKAKDEFYGKL